MNDEPLLSVKGLIDGNRATVEVYPDRVEWAALGMFKKRVATEVIPIRSVSSVTTAREKWAYKASVICSGNTIDIKGTPKDIDAIREVVTQLVLGTHPQQQLAVSLPPPESSSAPVSDELVKLAGLRDAGVLSDEEFAAAKARLLGS